MTKQDKVAKVMHEWKAGTLTSNGKQVTDYDQAVAIALSEAGLSKYAEGGSVGNDNFYVKSNFGNWAVTDRRNNKMVVGYSKKEDAIITAKGLNYIDNSEELNETISKLKTMKGYGHFLNQYADGGSVRGFYEDNVYVLFKTENDLNKVIKVLNEYGGHLNYQDQISSQGKIYHNIVGNKMVLFSNYAVDDIIELSRSYGAEIEKYSKDNTKYAEGGGIEEEVPLRADIDGDIYEVIGVNHKLNKVRAKDFSSGDVIEMPIDNWYKESFEFGTQAKFKANGREYVGMVVMKDGQKSISLYKDEDYSGDAERIVPFNKIDLKTLKSTMEKETFSKGGNIIERRYVNKDQDYETRYAKNRPSRMGYKDERKFAVGGEIGNTVSFKGDYGTPRSGVVKEKRGSSYIVATDDGDRLVDSYEVISFSETPIAKKKRFGFFEGGGEIENKIEKLKKVVSSKMLPESVKAKAQAEIDKLEKQLHESKETKAEEKEEHKVGDSEYKSKLEKDLEKELHRLQRDLNSSRLQTYNEGDNSEEEKARQRERTSKIIRMNEVLALLNEIEIGKENKMTGESEGERKAGMDEEEVYIEAKTKALEKSLKDKTISETQRKRDEKELALFKGAEAKKPTTRKAPVKKAVVKKAVAKKTEVKKEVETPAKPKADHKKLVAKLKAKKGDKEYDNRASVNVKTGERYKRSESSDKKREALPLGKRVSADGSIYYENRLNRGDLSKKDKFEDGGEVKSSDWGLNLNW
jgi:hypothetical protein